jgi:hypothetical protein
VLDHYPVFPSGRKLDPALLAPTQREALKLATSAAAEFRVMMGDDELVGPEDGIAAAAVVRAVASPT